VTQAEVRPLLEALAGQGVMPAGLTADSRSVTAGDLFAAYPGLRSDGRQYVADALARGAAAVLWESGDALPPPVLTVPCVPVEGLRALSGYLAHEIYGRPSEALWLAGVTGTNGKTTVSQWLARALSDLGQPCGIIGTLGCGFPGQLDAATNTTPDAPALHRQLARFRDAGAVAAAMEVSSIGLDQGRVNGACFDAAIFTNLTRDHLDYHGSMEAYAGAKAQLFDLPGLTGHVLNLDDTFGLDQARRLAARGARLIAYTLVPSNAQAVTGARLLVVTELRAIPAGMRFALLVDGERFEMNVPVVARFNVSNLLAVIGALLLRDVPVEEAVRVCSRLSAPEGRMQVLGGIGEPMVVIDYAHTPDALAKVLEAMRDSAQARGGRLVCVFGCGGDRDAGKRPLMGAVGAQLADRVLVTSDNPRSEDPEAIIAAIVAGAAGPGGTVEPVVERNLAIARAIAEAGPDDVVLIAGKGHEPYQEIHGQRLPFSDVAEARAGLAAWNASYGVPPQ
jgi:UDP-N-acetylmuramoyl-L-alanyl-D-glutamate--2,6-diaminopimelate ligase